MQARPSHSGFTLVEIMIVVVIIGVLAAMSVAAFRRVQRNAQNTRFLSDLRTFGQAFETYALKNGSWPPNAGSGAIPSGMSGEFKNASWQAPTPLGGRWNWDRNVNGFAAAISATGVTASDAQMAEIDAKIDDGDLAAGLFRKVSGRFSYVLED